MWGQREGARNKGLLKAGERQKTGSDSTQTDTPTPLSEIAGKGRAVWSHRLCKRVSLVPCARAKRRLLRPFCAVWQYRLYTGFSHRDQTFTAEKYWFVTYSFQDQGAVQNDRDSGKRVTLTRRNELEEAGGQTARCPARPGRCTIRTKGKMAKTRHDKR